MSEELYSTEGKYWTFEVNGHQRTLHYWAYPFLSLACSQTERDDQTFVLMIDGVEQLWVKAGDDVEFHIPERDPSFPQRPTQQDLDRFQEFGLYRHRQGYGIVDFYGNDVAFNAP